MRGSIALGFLLGSLLLLAGAPAALSGPAYTFTQVEGSPFTLGAYHSLSDKVVFSPNGRLLLSNALDGVYAQTVSKSGAVGRQA